MDYKAIRRALLSWYKKNARDLPWRRTRDPYAIWVSEIMLQQTRVAAVIPYWERFLERFPTVEALARAPEEELLAMWSGLGYYTRARNLQHAAREIAALGRFPGDYESIRKLKGVGDYTAAAVASIAFDLPFAVVDGNVSRVVKRLQNDPEADVRKEADLLLDRADPGRLNQALMELGALVCLPLSPACGECPVRVHCAAFAHGTQHRIPPPKARPAIVRVNKTLLVIRQGKEVLLTASPRVNGFWDLPEPDTPGLGNVEIQERLKMFRHSILNCLYSFEVREARLKNRARLQGKALWWCPVEKLKEIPFSTASRKAVTGLVIGMGDE